MADDRPSSAVPTAGSTTGPVLVRAFEECWGSIVSLGATLTEEQWNARALPPAWTAKDALIHLCAAEIGFADWSDLSKPPFGPIGAAAAELSALPGAEVLERFRAITDRRGEQLAAMSEAELDAPSWTAAGTGTYRRYMEIRVFDHWAHEQDVRVPLGLPGHLEGLGATMSLDEAHIAFGYLVGKRDGAPDGASVNVHVTGPNARDLHAVVEGRARVVEELASPTAEVTVDFLTFMLLCCGRIDPQGPLDSGAVTLAGDRDLAGRVARSLAFTI
jgi:uncharacterized protein (TIGR03083 family)